MTRPPSEFPGMIRWLWPAAFALAAGTAVLSLAGMLPGGPAGSSWHTLTTAAAGAAALLLLLILGLLARRARAGFPEATRPAAGSQRLAAGHGRAAPGTGMAGDAYGLGGHGGQPADPESARLAVVALARRVQAAAHRIQEEAVRMGDAHPGSPDVLESAMRLDHAAAQQARQAQSVAVVCGEWPGQQWPDPLPLTDVVRAAAGRIPAYQRVTVDGDPDLAATAPVVEPLIHLVAELLANAAQSSPQTAKVEVTVRTGPEGAVIEVDDAGVGMQEQQLARAREIASGRRLAGLAGLGEVPQTGLAVVGQYARRHGLRVDLQPSPAGGVRAVVVVPVGTARISGPARSPEPARISPARDHAGTAPAWHPATSPAADHVGS